MISSKVLVIWLVSLCVTYSSSAPSTKEILNKISFKHYKFPTNVTFEQLSYNETHLVYGLCNNNEYEKNCIVVLDSLAGTGEPLACNVTIKSSDKNNKINEYVPVVKLNNDRAVVLSKEGPNIRLTNVNFHNNCSTNWTVLASDESQHITSVNAVANENTYDVFFSNSALCQNRSCRVTFNNDGKIVEDIVPWGGEYDNKYRYIGRLQTVAHRSSVNGFIGKKIADGDEPLIFFVNKDGKETFSTKSKFEGTDIAVSTIGNNIIGICSTDWHVIPEPTDERLYATLECKQFDIEGKLLKTELKVNASSIIKTNKKKFHHIARLNLPKGFLLFTSLCPHNYFGGCAGDESYFVYHFSENGDMLKATEIKDFICEKHLQPNYPKVFKNEADQKCVILMCQTKNASIKELSIGVRCFTDDEL